MGSVDIFNISDSYTQRPNEKTALFFSIVLNGLVRQPKVLAFFACIAYNRCMQYTIRNVPDALDEALRRVARSQGKSLNEITIEALARGAGITGESRRQRDLRDIAGSWRKDAAFDRALAAQDTIDEAIWK